MKTLTVGPQLLNVQRSLNVIARKIYDNWQALKKEKTNEEYWGFRPQHPAEPYVHAMLNLNTIDDKYIAEDGRAIVCYFLANAQQWRGETAKRIKNELKEMLK